MKFYTMKIRILRHPLCQLLNRFEKLGLPNLGIQEKYARILAHFGRDIEFVSKLYQRNKTDPPIARDLPPVAGKITWARQLFRRIQVSHLSIIQSRYETLQFQ